MKIKNFILPIFILLLALPAWSKPRTRTSILEVASSMLIKNNPGVMRSPSKGTSLKIMDSNEAYTVVGLEGGSYAIISNDDLLPEVLAYSATEFNKDTDNPGFAWWSRAIRKVASEIVIRGAAEDRTLPDPTRFSPEVPALMSNVWGQMEPFNNLCPLEYNVSGRLIGHCLVGCVATSATQVMHYHQYPPKGEGVHIDMQTTDAFDKPIPLKIDFADYDFNWGKMRDSYSIGNYTQEEADAVAGLSYPVGVSFGMIYGTGASGTYSDSAAYALRKYLKFPNATLLERPNKNEKVWMETIYEELSHNRPVLYSGADPWGTIGGGGHAFVFDGYNSDGLVHVNWGWYGRNDGYYEVALLNPRIHSFVDNQDMIIGVAPPESLGNQTITESRSGTISIEELRSLVNLSKEGKLHELDLSEARLPEDRLPEDAFRGSRLQKIILPNTLRSIGSGAFGNCRNLREVVFPEINTDSKFFVENDIIYSADGKEVIAVMPYYHNYDKVIEDYASMLQFRPGVTTICPYAAEGCYRIQGVLIPKSVTRIGSYAFKDCSKLKVVKTESTLPANMAARAFASLDAGYTRLLVPAGSVDTYIRAGEWSKFFAFDNVYEFGTNVVARSYVRNKGDQNPDFKYQIFGDYVTGEPILTCEATPDSPQGEYPIKVAMGTLTGDNITLTDGVLRVLDLTSVEEIIAAGMPFDIYSIDGTLIRSGATSLDTLEKGIYIVEGLKVIVK